MTDDSIVREEEGYRLRLVRDEDAEAPYNAFASPLLRISADGLAVQHIDQPGRPRDDDERIEEAVRRWGSPRNRGEWALTVKYLKAFYGVTQVETWFSGTYWYVTYDSAAWRGYADADAGTASLAEYRAWCEGEVYGWDVEDADGGLVGAVGGYYGYEYALEQGLAEFRMITDAARQKKEQAKQERVKEDVVKRVLDDYKNGPFRYIAPYERDAKQNAERLDDLRARQLTAALTGHAGHYLTARQVLTDRADKKLQLLCTDCDTVLWDGQP